jgi:hypothetical protein
MLVYLLGCCVDCLTIRFTTKANEQQSCNCLCLPFPALFRIPLRLQIRMPSGMQGAKHSYLEGGIRNTLIVQGPGVKPGATDSTMIAISDIFPTLVDIAGVGASVPAGLPLDGISFKSVLLPGFSSSKINIKIAEDAAATAGGSTVQQQSSLTWRYLFMLGPACWGPNAVPELRPDR